MINGRDLRGALLGGVALTVMASSAVRANELADLKAQLDALQSLVNTLEQQRTQPSSNLAPGASFITFERGSRMDFIAQDKARDRVSQNDDTGFTIAITPSADMPAPVAEIVVYGYVKGDVIYNLEGSPNKFSFSLPGVDRSDDNDEFVFLHANQSRFGIKSKVDTAVGQIRSRIELDFFCASERDDFDPAFQGLGQNYCARLRKAYGEWDLTPNWTLLVGQEDKIAEPDVYVPLVDNGGDVGIGTGDRFAQVRATYHNGPLTWAVGFERPDDPSDTLIPNFGSFLTYEIGESAQVQLVGTIADRRLDPGQDLGDLQGDDERKIGWMIGAATTLDLSETVTFTAGALYTEGLADEWLGISSEVAVCEEIETQDQTCRIRGDLQAGFGVLAGLTFKVNETTSINVEGGYAQNIDANENQLLGVDHAFSAHGNVLWRPVKQIQLGWEVMWGREFFTDDTLACEEAANDNGDNLCGEFGDSARIQFGTWFFF